MQGTISDFIAECYETTRNGDEIEFIYHGGRDEGYIEVTPRSVDVNSETITENMLEKLIDGDIESALDDDYLRDALYEMKDEFDYCDGDGYVHAHDTAFYESEEIEYKPSHDDIELVESQWYRNVVITGTIQLPSNRTRGAEYHFNELLKDDFNIISESPAGCGLDVDFYVGDNALREIKKLMVEYYSKYLLTLI